jgi:hypothetical protein
MPRKKIEPTSLSNEAIQEIEQEWYTAGEAVKKMSDTNHRPVVRTYVAKLASLGKIRTKKIHDRIVLYSKSDVDAYRIEPLGKKGGDAKRMKYGKTGPTVREQRGAKKTEGDAA